MPVQPHSTPRGPWGRSAANHDLSHLFAEVTAARAADRLARDRRGFRDSAARDPHRLATSLLAYTRALEQYELPVPPAIRDELRLRSGLPQ